MLMMEKQAQKTQLQGVVVPMPEAMDEVQLLVLNSVGEVVSKTVRAGVDKGLQALDFDRQLRERLSDGLAFGLIKGFRKGAVVWERRLGRLSL